MQHQLKLMLQLMLKLKLTEKLKLKKKHWWESVGGLKNGVVSGVLGCPGRRHYNEL